MVARQFRVLEAASSSPATSTKKKRGCTPSFLFAVADRLELVLRAERSRIECAYSAQSARCSHQCGKQNNFALGQSPRYLLYFYRLLWLSPYFCLWCPNSTSSAQRNASALILQASASSSLVSRAQNYLAAGKAPATSKINPQVRNRHRFSLLFEHLNVFLNILQP